MGNNKRVSENDATVLTFLLGLRNLFTRMKREPRRIGQAVH